MPQVALLLLVSLATTIPLAYATWSGPSVAPAFSPSGLSAFLIDGEHTAPGFLQGNTPESSNWTAWELEVKSAVAAGVKIIGVCLTGSDYPVNGSVVLSDSTRKMFDFVLAAAPDALVLARLVLNAAGPGAQVSAAQLQARNGSLKNGPYPSLTSAYEKAAAARVATLLRLLDHAYPGRVAGVHLCSLAAGENTYNWSPTDFGWPDYSTPMVAEYCGAGGASASASASANCTAPSAVQRLTATMGNVFASSSSASFNLFLSQRVQRTISAAAAAAKAAMDGKGIVMAFYGYLNELGDARVAGSGHLGLGDLLKDDAIDGIVSPYKYDMRYRQPVGALATMGPMDAPPRRGKMWISEDDTRTSFVAPNVYTSCATTECDHQIMRRNLWQSLVHGAGLYQFDLILRGWFGDPARRNDTTSLWSAIRDARLTAERLFALDVKASESNSSGNSSGGGGGGGGGANLRPEVVVFVDDASQGHLTTGGIAGQLGPAGWLNALPDDLARIGAPTARYHLRDIEVVDLSTAKLIVLANAFMIDSELRGQISTKLATANRTVVYIYAPGYLNGNGAAVGPAAAADLLGCPMLDAGVGTLETEILPSSASTSLPLVTRLAFGSPLAGSHYGPAPSPGAAGIAPRLALNETAAALAGGPGLSSRFVTTLEPGHVALYSVTIAANQATTVDGVAVEIDHLDGVQQLTPPMALSAPDILKESENENTTLSPLNKIMAIVRHMGDPGSAELANEVRNNVTWNVSALTGVAPAGWASAPIKLGTKYISAGKGSSYYANVDGWKEWRFFKFTVSAAQLELSVRDINTRFPGTNISESAADYILVNVLYGNEVTGYFDHPMAYASSVANFSAYVE
eukprot:g1412.t1